MYTSAEDLRKSEEEAKRKKTEKQRLDSLIEEAKWNMYAERWELAKGNLENAMNNAVSLRDKAKINEILGLLKKCKLKQKIEPKS